MIYKRVRFSNIDTINKMAADGWRVVPGICPSLGGNYYLLMERAA